MIESLIRHWTAAGRTVVVATTLELGPGMHDRMSDLLDLTPYAYRLPSILPRDLWLDFIDRLLEALGPTTVVNVGSTWLHQNAKQIRQLHPDVRIVDQQFNTSGHVAGNIEADHAIDTTVVAYNELAEHFVEEGRNLDSIRTVFVGIDPPAPTSPEAIEALHENLGVAPDRPYVTFIGRLSEEKQPEWLPPLADALLARDTDLVVLGSGPLASALEPEFAKRKNLHWLSRMDSVEPLYAGSAVVVLPSKIEGIPLTLMESLAHGTPVVATAVGGIPELAGTPGLTLASAHDRDAWIDAVLDSLESPTENVVLPQRLSADNMAAEYDAIIDNQPAAG
jgi:glycosyltransferase involved in cell wall biosynthesis